MTVESITPVGKRKCRVLLDEGFALVLYRGEIKKYGIEEKGELSKECYQEILREVLCRRAKERVLYLLKAMDRTEEELRRKLREGEYPKEAENYALEYVKKMGYVNDEAYARRYVVCFSERKSKKQIMWDLQRKGISREIISSSMEETEIDEDGQIESLLRKKGYFKKKEDGADSFEYDRKEYQRAAGFLARKGFTWDAISRVLESKFHRMD